MFKNMRLLGIEPRLRVVDSAQYKQRIDNFDFDMVTDRKIIGGVPGEELLAYFGSKAGQTPGGLNLAGIDDPAVDALIEQALQAKSRAQLVVICRALDRVLRSGRYFDSQLVLAQPPRRRLGLFRTPRSSAETRSRHRQPVVVGRGKSRRRERRS